MTKANTHTMFGNSTMQKRLDTKLANDESSIIKDDKYSLSFVTRRATEITDNDVRRRIELMSMLEIIN